MDLKDCRCSHDSLKKLIQNSSKNKKKQAELQKSKQAKKFRIFASKLHLCLVIAGSKLLNFFQSAVYRLKTFLTDDVSLCIHIKIMV